MHGATPPPLPRLTVDQVDRVVTDGAQVVDIRSIERFAAGHVPGALSNPWRAQFATWLGWLVPRHQPVVFVSDDRVDRDDLVWSALTVGHEELAGELAGGMDAWQAAGRPIARTRLVAPPQADGQQVLDVRQRTEFAAGHVPGATHVELGTIRDDSDAVPDGPVLVHCGHGERAMSAASLLERAGHHDVAVLAGGARDLAEMETGTPA